MTNSADRAIINVSAKGETKGQTVKAQFKPV